MGHILIDILRNSILITGLVVVMMMMIESLNIESKGLVFKGLRKTKTGQVVIGALLGSIPGCMGGFATVSLYTHRMFSFGALIAMMIASSGDEAFVMLAMIPEQALVLFAMLFVIAVVAGIAVDKFVKAPAPECEEGYKVHAGHEEDEDSGSRSRHFGWKRVSMFVALAVFIGALASGQLGHDHGSHSHETHSHEAHSHEARSHETHGHEAHVHDAHCHEEHVHASGEICHEDHAEEGRTFHIDLLSEDWMNVLFAGLSIIVLIVLIFASDHFVEEHLWNHIVRRHLPTIFAWTFGVLLVLGIGLQYIDIERWISDNTVLMILLATAVGVIPESGPHLIFVTLFAAGVVPFPVLLASSISQDGHASIPLLAEDRKGFLWAKIINCVTALAAGFTAMLIM